VFLRAFVGTAPFAARDVSAGRNPLVDDGEAALFGIGLAGAGPEVQMAP
jgi:hypothetical protein